MTVDLTAALAAIRHLETVLTDLDVQDVDARAEISARIAQALDESASPVAAFVTGLGYEDAYRYGGHLAAFLDPESAQQLVRGLLSAASSVDLLTTVALLRLDCARRGEGTLRVGHTCPWCATRRMSATRTVHPPQQP